MYIVKIVITIIISYFLGNFSTGVMLTKLKGNVDIRTQGSGSSGATNMLRVNGRSMALLTLGGDMVKGMLAVCVGYLLVGGDLGGLIGATACVIGHDFPVLLDFKGGKGIATSFGALLLMYPIQSVLLLLTFIVIVLISHYVSVGSILSAFLYPFYIVFSVKLSPVCIALCFAIGLLAVFCHRANIKRLLDGNENKLDFSKLKNKVKK